MSSIGGSMMVCRGNRLDYCWLEAIESMLPVCDQFALILFSDDDYESFLKKYPAEPKIRMLKLNESDFDGRPGKERLAYWTNEARNLLTTDWHFNIQADEILHEDSYAAVRRAIENPIAEAYAVRRFNLWGDCFHYLNYPKIIEAGRHGHLPCSEYVVRLALMKYDSVGDAESLGGPFTWEYKDAIRTYHMGFTRDKRKKTDHIIHIQEKVFDLGFHDPRTDDDIRENDGKFRPYTRFSKDELLPISENLPRVIQKWASERNV